MKKGFLIIGLIVIVLMSSCKVNMDISLPSEKLVEENTKTLFYDDDSSDEVMKYFSAEYDLDFDDIPEKISVECRYIDEDEWVSEIIYSVGAAEYKVESAGGCIHAVYVCDINKDDGVKDIAVITNESSNDPVLRLLKYGETLVPYSFGDDESNSFLGTGYVGEPYFNLNNDGTITVKMQTRSAGMWFFMRNFTRNEFGVFEEIDQESYDILPEYMDYVLEYNSIDESETEMWNKGYIRAYCDYNNSNIRIKEGEYFRVLKDNDKDFIYVEKEDGSSGWINIGYDVEERYLLNPAFFFLAG